MYRRPVLVLALIAVATLAAAPLRGGWVIATVHDLPTHFVAGEPATLTFTLRQHGEQPLTGVEPSLLVRPADAGILTLRRRIAAVPTGQRGVYRATITPTTPGALSVEIDTDFHRWKSSLLDIPVLANGARAAHPAGVAHGRALFVAKGCNGCHVKGDDPLLREHVTVPAGPALTGRTFPSGFVVKKVMDPASLPPASTNANTARMPKLEVTEVEAAAIAGYMDGRAESIERVGALQTPRSVHTATTLPSGEVLLVGGMAAGGASLAAVESFDPANNSVRTLEPLAVARASHTATLLSNGRVLVAGGYDGEYLNTVEVFNPATRRFAPLGPLAEGRSGHTATLLPTGQILLAGGVGRGWTFLRSAELYDPATGRSEPVGDMLSPRESHTATLLADGRVLIVGGHNGRRQAMEVYASAEIFDPGTRRFTAAGTLGTARHKHDAVRLADGRVLVIGGADRSDRVYYATTEIYTPASGAFAPGPVMTHRRYKIAGTAVALANGDVLIPSGARVAELLDAKSLTFREVAGSYPEPYQFATSALLRNGDVVVAGGYDNMTRNTNGIWRFTATGSPPALRSRPQSPPTRTP